MNPLTKAAAVLAASMIVLLYQQMYSAVDEGMRTQRKQSINIDRLINSQVLMTESLKKASEVSHANHREIAGLEQKITIIQAGMANFVTRIELLETLKRIELFLTSMGLTIDDVGMPKSRSASK